MAHELQQAERRPKAARESCYKCTKVLAAARPKQPETAAARLEALKIETP
jgi:hypothetical protein